MLRTLYQAPVSFWHQIPIFSLTGEGGMVSGRFKCITLIVHLFIYIHYHYISSTSDHQPLDMGNWGPVLYGMFSLVIYFIYVHSINSVYMSIKSPNSSHHPLSPLRSICLFSMSGSLFLFCK